MRDGLKIIEHENVFSGGGVSGLSILWVIDWFVGLM